MPHGSHVFKRIKLVLGIFVEGHPVTIPQIILNSKERFQRRRVLKFALHKKPRPLAAMFF